MILTSKYSNTVEEYSNMDELKNEHPDGIINRVKIKQPHFFKFDGSEGSHHSILELSGTRYGYDNIIIGTNGASKTVYFLQDGMVQKTLNERSFQLLESDRFIVLGGYLYHIPTGKGVGIDERSFELVERMPNLIDFKGQDKQIEWTGSGFKKYDNIDAEEAEDSSLNLRKEDIESRDMRDVVDDSNVAYKRMLRSIVNDVYWINNIEEAEMYVNGQFEISQMQKEKRRYQEAKSKYANGEIDIEAFEQKLEEFLLENEEYIWVTGEYSETKISDFNDEEEAEEEEKNTAFDW